MDPTKLRTTLLINAASVLEKCEEQILPALYSRVGASFGATPTQLGNITLARSFMQALASPLAGIASHFMPRGRIIAVGCVLWATFTSLFACTSSIWVALPLCAMNGVGLALVIPSVQSLTADFNASHARGKAFGALWMTISFGGMLGALYATNMGALHPFGMDGWRFTFFSVAAVSILVGLLNAMFAHDPVYEIKLQQQQQQQLQQQQQQQQGVRNVPQVFPTRHLRQSAPRRLVTTPSLSSRSGSSESCRDAAHDDAHNPGSALLDNNGSSLILESASKQTTGPAPSNSEFLRPSFWTAVRSVVKDIGSVMRIPTFSIIITQGIIGSVPYASLVFLTLYFQLLGMSDALSSALVATYLIGGGLGGLLGGWIGDVAAKRWPNRGRIAMTQLSVASGIPFALVLFKGLPSLGNGVALYVVTIGAFAVCTSWPAPCANNPIFAEIVPVRLRNLVYSFDRCFEGAVAAFATPFVGLLSQRIFGFNGMSTVTGDALVDTRNATALGNALLTFLLIPWTLCLIIYTGLYYTYPRDRRLALEINREEQAMEWNGVSVEKKVTWQSTQPPALAAERPFTGVGGREEELVPLSLDAHNFI